ncbi:hypothetical protein ABW19_dt0202514 [Dactylella cylindrospora]|nr:hypothetical protein ABW19_dt0202514 [Dactylella cylindrospora]
MAKGNKKHSASAAEAPNSEMNLEIPSSNFLSKLTQRIEAGLSEPNKSSKPSKQPKTKTNGNRLPPTERNGSKLQINSRGPKPADRKDDQRGKKRDRNGSVIQSGPQTLPKKTHIKFGDDGVANAVPKTIATPSEKDEKPKPNEGSTDSKSKKDALLKEIIALGGTEEDLDLVDGVDTDSEEEETVVKETGKVKNTSKKEIEDFMKEIGLTAATFETEKVVDDAEVPEGESDEWTEDEESEDGSEVEADGAANPIENLDAVLPTKRSPELTQLPTKGPLVLEPQQDWYNIVLPELPPSDPIGPSAVSALQSRGKDLLLSENSSYMTHNLSKDTNLQFLSQIMTSGTVEDKISALTIVCTASPLHTTKTLESLLNLAKKKSRNQTIASLAAIKDLFANGSVLPSDRKLKPFAKQPLSDLLEYQKAKGEDQIFKAYLLLWTFEDWLKDFYFEVLKTLEVVANDAGVTWVRMKSIDMVFELLKEKPEGEANLMRLLVNKLGDPDRKVASKTSHLLLQLEVAHPAMKPIVISSIESDALLKSNKNSHARYYSVITLNQTILTRADDSVANQLLKIYFALFADILGKTKLPPNTAKTQPGKLSQKAKKKLKQEQKDADLEEESNSKLISAILTGVNRAFPFASIDDDVFNKHLDTLFRITHGSNFNTSIQALTLIFQVSSSKQMVSDRFYRSLYESLLDPRLSNSSKQAMYLNLLFKALKTDHKLARVQAFVKRIIQTASMHQPPFICGVFYMLRELEGSFPTLKNMLDKPLDDDSEEEDFRDVDDERGATAQKPPTDVQKHGKEYDGRKRDPLYANADRSSMWELVPFLSHFHPTVALYANSLHNNSSMPSKPDLSLHTLTHFLDRFVYRNAKSAASTKGSSIMQPLAGGDTRGMILSTKTAGRGLAPVNSEAFSNLKEEDVKEDEVFFHRFFTMKKQGDASKIQKKKKKDEQDEQEDSEFDDEEAWEAMVESRPDLDVDLDDDEDVDMDDFDDDDLNEDLSDVDFDDEDAVMEGLTTDAFGDLEDEEMDDNDSVDASIGQGDNSDSDAIDLDDSDIEAGINSDDDIPSDIDAKITEVTKAVKASKRKDPTSDAKESRKEKRRKLKNLPVFASADDYAALIGGDEDEDM